MRKLKLIAAVLARCALSACVGIIVPVPVSNSTNAQDTDRDQQRR